MLGNSEAIAQVLWGKSFVDVKDGDGEEHTLVLRSLSIQESNYLNFLYNKELKAAQEEGILTQDQFRRLFNSQNIWGQNEEERRETLKKDRILVGSQIKDSEFHTVRKKKLIKKLEQIEAEIREIDHQEMAIFSMAAENRAEEMKRRLMVYMFTETPEEKSLWSSKEEFMKSNDSQFLNNLILAYFHNNIYPEKQLRSIARSSEWRFRWIAAKHGEQLFGKPISQWSEMQNMLVYWSEYYDSIYESMDRPAEYIIEDDASCDSWLKNQNKKASQDRGNSNKGKIKNKLEHGERFVMVAKDDPEAISKVQQMNPDQVRDQIRQEFEQIKQTGRRVKEWELGERKQSTKIIKRKGKK